MNQADPFLDGLRATKSNLEQMIAKQANNTVQSGPFSGLVLPDLDIDSLAPKLLGCYESELHAVIEQAISEQPDLIVNIGCAEGFYAVGLTMRLSGVHCVASDALRSERDRCRRTANQNDCESAIELIGALNHRGLNECLSGATKPFVVCDCEGCEAELLDPNHVPKLRESIMIVELHDRPGESAIKQQLHSRFRDTHEIEFVRSGARDPGAYAQIRPLNQFLQYLAVCEFRDWTMEWAIMRPSQLDPTIAWAPPPNSRLKRHNPDR